MASRDFLKHVVSTSEPVGSTLGDEYYNPSSNKLFKRLAVNGTSVQWVEKQQSIAVQSSGVTVATGARTINFPGATIGYNSVTDTITIQSSGIPGGADTNIQFNNSGAFAGSGNLTWNNGTQTLGITGFLTTFALNRSGNINAPTWTTTSPVFNSAAAILTDLTGSGTIALKVGHSFLSPNFASSSGTTITDAANLYVNPAVASTNTTITNNWSLYVAGNQRITGTLFSDADIQLSGSRVVDYKNSTAQWTVNGGGVVTWNGSSVLWNQRILVIPVARSIMGSAGYFEIACPTSGTVTYFNSSNVTTTVTCTAAGIPLASYEALYYELNVGGTNASEQTRFRVVNYLNSTWRPSSGWILLAAVNGDGTNIGHLQWIPGQINLPTTGATVTYNTGTGVSSWAAGTGTVTAVSVASANGFAGTSSGGATPALTLTTSITGMLRGNGTAISAATAGTDFLAPSGTFNLGTTSITFNRASGAQSLTGINIDGSAGTAGSATNSTYMLTFDDRVKAPSDDDAGKMRFGFTSYANNNTSPYGDYLHLRSYTDGTGGNDNLVMFRKDAIGMRIYQQAWGSATAYSTFKDVAFTDTTFNLGTTSIALNRASGAQSLTGINIDGSAGSATSSTFTRALQQTDATNFINPIDPRAASGSRSVSLNPNQYAYGLFSEFKNSSLFGFGGNYSGLITYANWQGTTVSTGDPTYQLLFSPSGVNATANPSLRFRAGIDTTWGAWGEISHTQKTDLNIQYNSIGVGVAAGGTTGFLSVSYQAVINTTTPGTTRYGIHLQGQTTADQANGITWNGGTGTTGAQAGIYVQGSGAYGTRMFIATTDSYATGSQTAISIDQAGAVQIVRNNLTVNLGYMIQSTATSLTAAGTTQGTALLLTRQINDVTSVAANTGVRLPVAVAGMRIIVRNSSATNLNVYPNTGAQIQTLGTNVAMVLVAATMLEYVAVSATQWYLMNSVFA